jgi:xylose isomerase
MSTWVFVGDKEFFPDISKINYEGPGSDNPLAFKVYDADREVAGRSMREWLRFSVCYWHTFTGAGQDMFGADSRVFPWDEDSNDMNKARDRLDAAFEFTSKLGTPYYCFHDRDLAPEGSSIVESEAQLQSMVGLAGERQKETGIKLLWGTANLFNHPRYMNGAATNPDFKVVAHAAAQVKAALDATVELGGENYVFWGGREGYATLLNTNTRRELDHMATFLTKARDYGRKIGFKGKFLIEPKPMEPMKHQYDFDVSTVIGFIRHYGLQDDFKLNVEANHATLAGHAFDHELQFAADAGLLGSVDANRGNAQNGWDTDQFPLDIDDAICAMLVVLNQGGISPGGMNFDAKLRRESVDLADLFLAHIGGMDTFARGLIIADRIRADGRYDKFREERYQSFDVGEGQAFETGKLDFERLHAIAVNNGEPEVISGKQEWLENIVMDMAIQ